MNISATSKGLMEGGYLYPSSEGVTYRGFRYSAHALERMAPDTPGIVDMLLQRACSDMTKRVSDGRSSLSTRRWWKRYLVKPRGIRPDEVERAIGQKGKSGLTVIRAGDTIVTVYRAEDSYTHLSAEALTANKKILQRAHRLQSGEIKTRVVNVNTQWKFRGQSRWARRIRDKVLELADKVEMWDKMHLEMKARKFKKHVDIAAWKASHRGQRSNHHEKNSVPERQACKPPRKNISPTTSCEEKTSDESVLYDDSVFGSLFI